jgi:hypothetical protein
MAMGLGMQIIYLGFPGSPAIEAEAGVQLLRLRRFSALVLECRLAIELLRWHGQPPTYEVRLDLVSRSNELYSGGYCEGEDPGAAVRAAFDAAVRLLLASSADGPRGKGAPSSER